MSGSVGWMILASGNPMDHVLPHRLSESLPAWFTNHMMMLLVAAAVCLLIFPVAARRVALVPSGMVNLLESVMQYLRKEVAEPCLKEDTDRFIPYVWTTFFFILICNLLGMVPLEGLFLLVFKVRHVGGTATAGLSVTAGLAVFAFFMIHVSGVWQVAYKLWQGIDLHGHDPDHGEGGHTAPQPQPLPLALVLGFFLYWWNFAPHVFRPERTASLQDVALWVADVLFWVFLLLLELIGAAVKPFALAMRLMANMLAGHVVLGSLLLMIPVLGSLSDLGIAVPTLLGAAAINVLELFVAFLQAYIFTFLTCMFIGASIHPEH